ncbi:Tn3 family transposase [Nonomuraea sp. NBC_01738]|uniref:Tn3 family transposase n=1 Tax=Nonomuraea sp. NBC_01738 TaxID=2976003 RepID=UPI003FA370BB
MLRHLTDAEIDRQYTDTHGASIVGFAFSELLGFKLLPRLKNIGSARLYRPGTGEDEAWPRPEAVLSNKTITGGGVLFQPCTIPRSEGLLMQRL